MASKKHIKKLSKQAAKRRSRKLRNQLTSEHPKPIEKPVWIQSAIDQAVENASRSIDPNYPSHSISEKTRKWYYWLRFSQFRFVSEDVAAIFVPAVRQIIERELSKTTNPTNVDVALLKFDQDIANADSKIVKLKPDEEKGLLGIPLSLT